jgi:hypothetical protein
MKTFKKKERSNKVQREEKFRDMKEGTPIAITSSYKNALKKKEKQHSSKRKINLEIFECEL